MSYDVKCDELARQFLSDVGHQNDEPMVRELAQDIQNLIEEFLTMKGFDK